MHVTVAAMLYVSSIWLLVIAYSLSLSCFVCEFSRIKYDNGMGHRGTCPLKFVHVLLPDFYTSLTLFA